MRLFIAADLPEDLKEKLGKLTADLKKADILEGNFVKPHLLHLTLKFLGETTEAKVDEVKKALQSSTANTKKFFVSLHGIGHFNYKILWAGGSSPELAELAAKIDSAAHELGFEKENREYAIHLTLARIKSVKNKDKFKEILEKYSSAQWGSFDVSEIKLMKSTLGREGAVYEVVGSFKLQ